jgi:hypothetical protein
MSLTSELRTVDSFARRFIDTWFPELKVISRQCNKELRSLGAAENPHDHKTVSMLVGTAIDYRVRAYFRRAVYRSGMVQEGLRVLQQTPQLQFFEISETRPPKMKRIKNPWYYGHRKRVAERLKGSFDRFAAKNKLRRPLGDAAEDRMCRYCVLFAYLDWIGRSPYGSSAMERMMLLGRSTISKMLRQVDTSIVADVRTLSRIFIERNQSLISNARRITLGCALVGSTEVVGGNRFQSKSETEDHDGCLAPTRWLLASRLW